MAWYYPAIDEALEEYRIQKNTTYRQIAALLGMSESKLRERRRGKLDFKVDELVTIGKLTGRTYEELLEGRRRRL